MYEVQITQDSITVFGPEGFEKTLPADGIGIVLREDVENPESELARSYTIPFAKMTKAEIVGCALGMTAYPS